MARNVVIRITLAVVVALFTIMAVNARDLGQWDDPANADLKRWYQDRQVNLTISLAFLAPNLVKAAVEGRLPLVARLNDQPAR